MNANQQGVYRGEIWNYASSGYAVHVFGARGKATIQAHSEQLPDGPKPGHYRITMPWGSYIDVAAQATSPERIMAVAAKAAGTRDYINEDATQRPAFRVNVIQGTSVYVADEVDAHRQALYAAVDAVSASAVIETQWIGPRYDELTLAVAGHKTLIRFGAHTLVLVLRNGDVSIIGRVATPKTWMLTEWTDMLNAIDVATDGALLRSMTDGTIQIVRGGRVRDINIVD